MFPFSSILMGLFYFSTTNLNFYYKANSLKEHFLKVS